MKSLFERLKEMIFKGTERIADDNFFSGGNPMTKSAEETELNFNDCTSETDEE